MWGHDGKGSAFLKREKKKGHAVFILVRRLVELFYPKIKVVGEEHLPDEPVIIVGNHCQMNGPIVGELYVPGAPYIWCAGEMMQLKDVPDYAYEDFWSRKPKWCRPFYRLLSYIIAPLSVCIFNNARTIAVYRDARILSTFKSTIKCLEAGRSVVIYPEHDVPHNHILFEFQDKFIDIARLYYKKTGRKLNFVPMYIAPKLKTLYLGKPICFSPAEEMESERRRICDYLMQEITNMAEAQPEHRVVMYR